MLKGLYSYHWLTGVLAGSALIFGAVYTLRAYQLSMFGAPTLASFEDLKWNEWLAFFIIMIIVVVLGVCPQLVFNLVGPSIEHLIESYKISNTIIK